MFDPESVFFWKGLRSYVFHVGADSENDPKIRSIKSILSHPGICFTLESLSAETASHALEEDYKVMRHDLHSLRIGKKRIHKSDRGYSDDVSELHASIKRSGEKIFRVKVLFDADKIDRRTVNDMLGRLWEFRPLE